jgi:PTH1 family peptidyl-tRNA hydrolase
VVGRPDDVWAVVGLGNPGPRYAGNRHNVGQMVLDELAERSHVMFTASTKKSIGHIGAVSASTRLGTVAGGRPGPALVLVKPTTYMNDSGLPVRQLMRYLGITSGTLIVVHDDIDLPFGDVRLKIGGGEGGHNGLRDISRVLGTPNYLRVRVGVDRPPGKHDPAQYVLSDFTVGEREHLDEIICRAADAVEVLVKDGLLNAQQRFHSPPAPVKPRPSAPSRPLGEGESVEADGPPVPRVAARNSPRYKKIERPMIIPPISGSRLPDLARHPVRTFRTEEPPAPGG